MSEQSFQAKLSEHTLIYYPALSLSISRSQLLNRFREDALEFVAVAVSVDVAALCLRRRTHSVYFGFVRHFHVIYL